MGPRGEEGRKKGRRRGEEGTKKERKSDPRWKRIEGKDPLCVGGCRGEKYNGGWGEEGDIPTIDGYRVGELVREIIRRARACRWKPHAALFKLNPVRIIIGGQVGAEPAHSAGAFANTRRKRGAVGVR